MRNIFSVLAIITTLGSYDAYAAECIPEVASVCVLSGCERAQSTITIYTDVSNKIVNRCDSNGCDAITVDIRQSGAMQKMTNPNSDYLLVINTISLTFTEIATASTTAFVKSGICSDL